MHSAFQYTNSFEYQKKENMGDKKQTAVQWLVNVVQSCIAPNYIPKEIINQALRMEREQIKSTFRDAQIFEVKEYSITDVQYYEQTYGGQDNGE